MADTTEFMRRAIEISRREMLESGAAPFAAVIVKNGAIVGEGVNRVASRCDATAHGEVEAIRDAGRRLGSWDLSGCDLYTTCEPCEMCVAAMVWARVDRLYYANTLADCEAIGFDLAPLRAAVRADLPDRAMPATRLLAEEARAVLDLWTRQPGFTVFKG
ncbi:MAG: nucleoside deaminase [Rhodobacteraceae bacterium]|nr:MAG: nucleoside deaminase [Paracoccaceae bacterium]